jgi:hypothetical protein
MADTVDIKKLFSLIPVNKLRELAYRHNVETGIKAPSQMLKAELVNSISKHYQSLTGTNLIPIEPKPLSIPFSDIPEKFKPKKPKKETNQAKMVSVRAAPYDVSREKRQIKAMEYGTEQKLKEAIKRREKRQTKAKETREKKKTEVKPAIKEVKKEVEKMESKSVFVNQLQDLVDRTEKLKSMKKGKEGMKLYNNSLFELETIQRNMRGKDITAKDLKVIEKLEKEINDILEDDDIMDKFYYEDD